MCPAMMTKKIGKVHAIPFFDYVCIYSIISLRNLEQLDLKGNSRIKRLPQELGNLQSLMQLNVSRCDLKALPDRWV